MRLRPFTHIENSLEFIIERPFSMLFKRSVQPAEIGKRLKRELLSGQIVSVRGRLAPNDFSVMLNPSDFQPYEEHGKLLSEDLEAWLEDVAASSNIATAGPIRVRFRADESVRRGRFDVKSALVDDVPEPVQYVDPGMTEAFDVVQRPGASTSGFIEVCSGPATGSVFAIRKQHVTIGRDLSNDLVIDSAEISRFHAEMRVLSHAIMVSDQRSLNGTFVNGQQLVGSSPVRDGDQLIFGTTICRYWRELK